MRHLEHSDEAIILGSGASTDEAIRLSLRLSRHRKGQKTTIAQSILEMSR